MGPQERIPGFPMISLVIGILVRKTSSRPWADMPISPWPGSQWA